MHNNFPQFYSKNFPYNSGGFWNGNNQNPSNFPPVPWNMVMQPPYKNFEQMMGPYHQFHQQQQAFLQSGSKAQNFQAPQPVNSQKPQEFTSMFGHIDGFMKNANKYYPYVKKAGSFLNTINKFM